MAARSVLTKVLSVFGVCFSFAVAGQAQTADDLFNQDVLHEVRIDMRPADWLYLKDHYLEDTYVPCNFSWRFNGRNVDAPQIGCRNRGTGSRTPIKPGLRLQINRYDKDRKFLGLTTIVMRNNSQDASMMRERVAMAFMRRMGIPAPRSTHARVYVNNQYFGLYTIVEEVDEVFTKRVYGDGSGYLYKYDYAATDPAHYFEYLGSDPKLYSPKPFKPESHEDDPQIAVIEAMIRTLNQAPDATFEQAISQYVDLRAFLLEVGVEAFVGEQDGMLGDYGLNNFYMYRLPNSSRFNFIPWDKSNAFFTIDRDVYAGHLANNLMRRTMLIPAMRAYFIDILLKSMASAGGPGGWLEQEIAREYAQVRAAALEDPNKVCDHGATGNLRPCSNAEFEAEVAFLLRFARERNDLITWQLSWTFNAIPAQQPFRITDRGGVSMTTTGAGASPVIGYARIQPNVGNRAPAGLAIFGNRVDGVLVSETAVPAVAPIRSGRIYAEVGENVNTGVAIANANAEAAQISFYFTDPTGRNSGQGSLTIPAGRQIAAFLNEGPFNGGPSVAGSFTFTSNVPVAVVALRSITNERSETLLSTLPVIDMANPATGSVLAHSVDGAGWSTRTVLVNPFDDAITGTISVQRQDGSGNLVSPEVLSYTLAPRSSTTITPASGGSLRNGWVQVTGSPRQPSAFAIFSYTNGSVTIASASVPAVRTGSAFRMFIERAGPSLQSGVAIANTSASPAVVNFEVTNLDGQTVGLTGSMTIGAARQVSVFVNEIPGLQSLDLQFRGVLRITSPSGGLGITGLRGRTNERGEFLITTTPPLFESDSPPAAELIIPHLVDSGGYTTQLILYGAYAGQNSVGLIQFFTQAGVGLELRYQP